MTVISHLPDTAGVAQEAEGLRDQAARPRSAPSSPHPRRPCLNGLQMTNDRAARYCVGRWRRNKPVAASVTALEMQASMEPEASDPKRVCLARRKSCAHVRSRSTPDAFPQRPTRPRPTCSQTVRMSVRLCMDMTEPATTAGAGVCGCLRSTMHRRCMVEGRPVNLSNNIATAQ
jgi:hypothetical protein